MSALSSLVAAPLAPAHEATFSAAAAYWPGGAYDMNAYDTPGAALRAYGSFHAASQREGTAAVGSLVFVPNQYGLGNRLRAMKASLLLAMLTGRAFYVRWDEPFALSAVLRPERIDWRESSRPAAAGKAAVLCLPFATHTLALPAADCNHGLAALQRADLRARYAESATLEVHTFTDLNIYLSQNPHYAALLARMAPGCPKRMGCLYDFLFTPQPVVKSRLDALLGGGGWPRGHQHVGVQVRNRLWQLESMKLPTGAAGQGNPPRLVVSCMARFVPPGSHVFFTADDDALYAVARAQWGEMLIAQQGGVYKAWSQGSKPLASAPSEGEASALLKAFVDWFALRNAARIVYTHQSSFGKTAAEASDAPNLDLNHTRCAAAVKAGLDWASTPDDELQVTYDTRAVPGAKDYQAKSQAGGGRVERDEL